MTFSIRLLLSALPIVVIAATATAEAQSKKIVSLVEARLTSVQDVTGQPGVPCICDEHGNVMFDGSFRLTFSPTRTLAGAKFSDPLTLDQASARPFTGGRYLILLTRSGGETEVLWRGLRRYGLCADNADVAKYGLSKMAKRLPCRD